MRKNISFVTMSFLITITVLLSCSSDSSSFKFNPDTLDFGNVNLGEYNQLTIEITNKYGKAVLITDLDLSDNSVLAFISGKVLPIDLANGASHTLEIRYTPSIAGTMNETLTIVHNASNKDTLVSIIGEAIAVPRIQIDKTSHDFSYVLVNTADTFDIKITNSGTAELTLNSLTFNGPGASGYSITSGGNVPVVINPGVIHKITIQFYPIAEVNYSAELAIDHDAIDSTNPIIVTVSGDGKIVRPKITLNRTGLWDFGVASAAAPVTETLEIENTGTDDLKVAGLSFSVGTDFSVTAIEDTVGGTISLPATIIPSDKIIVSVKFEPTATAIFNDTLKINHDGINVSSPIDLSITGEGKFAISQSFSYTGKFDTWTVPVGVTLIRIEAWGGQGGGASGGKGARVRGDFTVTPGEVLTLIVAENGYVTAQGTAYGAGGGGGSFVYRNATDSTPLIAAGGGGGQSEYNYGSSANGGDGSHTDTATPGAGSGSGSGGTGGNGGAGGLSVGNYSTGGGGCGWLTDGKNGLNIRNPEGKGGQCPRNGAKGGEFTHSSTSYCAGQAGDGGFGGGGGMSDNTGAGGGGGGWNGGPGGNNYLGSGKWGSGGGAGSYNGGSNKDGASGVQSGHGKIVISY